jgi:hypothetical protein
MTLADSTAQRIDSSLMREASALKTLSEELQAVSIQMLKKEEHYTATEITLKTILTKLGVTESQLLMLTKAGESAESIADDAQEVSALLSSGTKFVNYSMFQKILASVAKVFLSEFRMEISASEVKLSSRTRIVHKCSVIIPITQNHLTSYLSFYWSDVFLESINLSTMGELSRYFGADSLVDNIAAQVSVELSMSAELDVLPPQKPGTASEPKPLMSVIFSSLSDKKNSFEMYIH